MSSLSYPQLHKGWFPAAGPRFWSTYARRLLIKIYKVEAFRIYQKTQGEDLTLLKATAKCLKGFGKVQNLNQRCWEAQNMTLVQLWVDEKLAIKLRHTVPSPVFLFFPHRKVTCFYERVWVQSIKLSTQKYRRNIFCRLNYGNLHLIFLWISSILQHRKWNSLLHVSILYPISVRLSKPWSALF